MKKVVYLVAMALLAMALLAPAALAQESTMMMEGGNTVSGAGSTQPLQDTSGGLPISGGPAILLPAAALLLGSGILTFAVLRRR